jgi:uncharacterized surface protein with fasciclin (FAS1) repeats
MNKRDITIAALVAATALATLLAAENPMVGGGKATLKTLNGESLTAAMDGDSVELTDAKGGVSKVTTADVMQSNGVIHVVDTVLMP